MKKKFFRMTFALLTGHLKEIDLKTTDKVEAEKRAKKIAIAQKQLIFKGYCIN